MIEIRDTFRGGEDAEIEASMGKGMERGYPPPYPLAIRLYASKLPQRGSRRSPARSKILCVLSSTECIYDSQAKTSEWSTAFRSTAWTATHSDVKSGQIRDRVRNSGQFSVPNDLVFFSGLRTCPQKSGLSRTIRDGWSPYLVDISL